METGTRKLYYEDTHMLDFTARILEYTHAETDDRLWVTLEQTAFFPEEGGQKADRGMLAGFPVLDVRIQGGVISHLLPSKAREVIQKAVQIDTPVTGHVDWEQRFDFMQQHTGEHILSGLVHSRFCFRNVGFHLGYEEVTLDFDGVISPEDMQKIETEANRIIHRNLPVLASFPTPEVLETLQYRSKIEIAEAVRIVEIPGVDICACCAPHVETTGQIGLIKVTGLQSHRGGVRVGILCGMRALRDYTKKQESVTDLSVLLSAKPESVGGAVRRLMEENQNRQMRINALQSRLLSDRLGSLPAASLKSPVFLFEETLDSKAVRDAVNTMTQKYEGYCGIFSGSDTDGYLYVIGSRTLDCRTAADLLRQNHSAKGGGSPRMVQGTVNAPKQHIEDTLTFLTSTESPENTP